MPKHLLVELTVALLFPTDALLAIWGTNGFQNLQRPFDRHNEFLVASSGIFMTSTFYCAAMAMRINLHLKGCTSCLLPLLHCAFQGWFWVFLLLTSMSENATLIAWSFWVDVGAIGIVLTAMAVKSWQWQESRQLEYSEFF